MHVLRAVLKHVPSWNMFQIGIVCRSEKCAHFWNMLQIGAVQTSSYRGRKQGPEAWKLVQGDQKQAQHTPDTLGTLPDIAANARPLRAWLKCSLNVAQLQITHAKVWQICRVTAKVFARVNLYTLVWQNHAPWRAQGTGVGRDIRQSPSRVRSVFLLIYEAQATADLFVCVFVFQ